MGFFEIVFLFLVLFVIWDFLNCICKKEGEKEK